MEKKKAMESTLLAVIGIGLITTAVILLAKKGRKVIEEKSADPRIASYDDDDDSSGLHVFSETGILL